MNDTKTLEITATGAIGLEEGTTGADAPADPTENIAGATAAGSAAAATETPRPTEPSPEEYSRQCLELLKGGNVGAFNALRIKNPGIILDLHEANLYEANLYRANLNGADLSGAKLAGANLIDAYLSGADLRGAKLAGANLIDAYLSGADLRGANLRGAKLAGANLSGAYLRGAILIDADLSGATLAKAEGLTADQLSETISLTNVSILEIERPLFEEATELKAKATIAGFVIVDSHS